MNSDGTLLKKVNAGSRIVFDGPYMFCLVLQGRINTAAPGRRQEVGAGGMITSDMYAYAIESSELLFINQQKLRELKPELAARIAGGVKEQERPATPKPAAMQERTAYSYSVDAQCPVCKGHFRANKLFESKLKQVSHDPELRTRFEDIEPLHYRTWVCPHCLYANLMSRWADLGSSQRAALKESAAERKSILSDLPEPGGEAEKAINDYRLVINCLARMKDASNATAGAWLNVAWLHDDQGEVDLATTARKNSLAAYEEFYFQSRSLTPPVELQAIYIIAQLSKRLGDNKKAHEYFLRVLHYKAHNMAILTDLARDSLHELKKMTKETA
jgi:hypothetical protein